jgi:hypothetical protein
MHDSANTKRKPRIREREREREIARESKVAAKGRKEESGSLTAADNDDNDDNDDDEAEEA